MIVIQTFYFPIRKSKLKGLISRWVLDKTTVRFWKVFQNLQSKASFWLDWLGCYPFDIESLYNFQRFKSKRSGKDRIIFIWQLFAHFSWIDLLATKKGKKSTEKRSVILKFITRKRKKKEYFLDRHNIVNQFLLFAITTSLGLSVRYRQSFIIE